MAFLTLSLIGLLAVSGDAARLSHSGDVRRGEITGPIVSTSDPGQRYVIYLPQSADLRTPRPILYVMDYRGRARLAADVFRPAAERLGWIVISSYNTASDGAGRSNASAIKAMWIDSHDMFAIDDRRTYVAGLSGTARMAAVFAGGASGSITGVIGAAAGFPPDAPPTPAMAFLYYGTAGTIDYNYWEMRGLDTELSKLRKPHRIAFFDGPHAWMPPELAMAALCWMEVRAMKAGARPIDRTLVEERWTRDLERARTLEADGLVWEASQLLAAMADDYASLRSPDEIAEVSRRGQQLAQTSTALSQARRQQREAIDHDVRVNRRLQILAAAFPASAEEPVISVPQTVWNLDIEKLLKTARGASEEARAAGRVLAQLHVQTAFYLPAEALDQGKVERARFYLGIAEAIDPSDSYSWYLRAAVEARSRREGRALDALKRAVSLGFQTADALEHDASFARLRQLPEFAALVEQARARAR